MEKDATGKAASAGLIGVLRKENDGFLVKEIGIHEKKAKEACVASSFSSATSLGKTFSSLKVAETVEPQVGTTPPISPILAPILNTIELVESVGPLDDILSDGSTNTLRKVKSKKLVEFYGPVSFKFNRPNVLKRGGKPKRKPSKRFQKNKSVCDFTNGGTSVKSKDYLPFCEVSSKSKEKYDTTVMGVGSSGKTISTMKGDGNSASDIGVRPADSNIARCNHRILSNFDFLAEGKL